MNLEKLLKREILITVVTVSIIALGFFAFSYAYFKQTDTGKTNAITFGDIKLTFCNDTSCETTVQNLGRTIGVTTSGGVTTPNTILPLTDAEGLATAPYIFKVTNTGNLKLTAKVILEPDLTFVTGIAGNDPFGVPYSSYTRVADDQMKIAIVENSVAPTPADSILYSTLTNREIKSGIVLNPGDIKIYKVYIWEKSDALNTSQGKYFVTNIKVAGDYIPE
ncbi:MAG: hypothetical protein RSB41_00280 [Bacilli bacterium]